MSGSSADMKISVMITTRNRCSELRRTLEVLQAMTPRADEVLVTADGCADGTEEMVRTEYPDCRFWSNQPGTGSVPSRDRMLREATGDLVLSLDDDSYPVDRDFFARLPELFKKHPEAAVISFPEMLDGDNYYPATKTPKSPGHYTSAYPNSTAAMRRDIYLRLPGYPGFFSHAYEEPDYALQCYAHQWAVWFAPELIIRHHMSPKNRNQLETHHFHARNELWSVWLRCPWPWLPFVSLFRAWRQFVHACGHGLSWVAREPLWWMAAARGFMVCWRRRSPVRWPLYYGWMRLAREPITQRAELEGRFGTGGGRA